MTNDQHNQEHAQEPREPMNVAALLRAAADGELSDCQSDQLDAYLAANPEAQSQIEFEKALKGCCSRAMTKPSCPDALRAMIQAIAADTSPAQDDSAYAARIEASNEHTRSKSFWMRSPMMSAAAALLILVAGTMIWQSASYSFNNSAPEHLNSRQASYFNRVSNFVVDEHERCCDDRAAQRKLIKHDIEQATQYFSEAFEAPLTMPVMNEEEGQIEFYGGGDCAVPSTKRSGHLRFDAISPDGERISLSLFVSPDPKLLPMEEGKTYAINAKACTDAGTHLFAWVNGGVQYLLVSEAGEDMCKKVRDIMQAPAEIGSI